MRLLRPLLAFLSLISLIASTAFSAERAAAEAERVTRQVLERAIVIDTHADTPQMMLDEGYDLADPASPFMISIPKMREGRLGAEFFSIWVQVEWPRATLVRRTLDLIDVVEEQVARHSDALGFARTADEIVRLHAQGKIAILMGIEGGHTIENDLRVLDTYYRLGVRYMTLTHTRNTDWADSSRDKARWNGLTDFGRQVVARMNRLGMMVDISHVSDKTFDDVLAVSKAPVIASHSSCRALSNQPRNLTDDMIRALAKNGGVVQVNFYSAFLDPAYGRAFHAIEKQGEAEVAAARRRYGEDRKRLAEEERRIWARYEANLPTPSCERIADHIEHIVKVAGADYAGLGSDFDGVHSIPRGMEDASKLPDLVRELARRGMSGEDLEKILGGNLLRVMRRVEAVRENLRDREEAKQ